MSQERRSEVLQEAMYNHLNVAYLNATKGQPEKLNSIIEQLGKSSKQSQQVTQWVEMFTRLIIQLKKTHQDPKIIIDIVLYKIPWFSSDNHMKALASFRQSIMTIISLMPQRLQSVYQRLVEQLNIDQDLSAQNQTSVTLGSRTFENKESLINAVQLILCSVETISEDQIVSLDSTNQEFMRELFKHHPSHPTKLEGCKSIGIGYFPSRKATKCFYIIREDHSHEDISYLKCADNLYENLNKDSHIQSYISQQQKYYKVMKLITELDSINKLQQGKLIQILSDAFPHKTRPLFYLKTYVMNLLYLADMIVPIRCRIIRIIYTNLVSIDSEIRVDKRIKPLKEKDEMTKKLEALFTILMDYLQDKIDTKYQSQIDWNNKSKVQIEEVHMMDIFREMSKIFFEQILKNQQCVMVHQVYVYLCAQPSFPKIQKLFISKLILYITDNNQNLSKQQRINAIFYLSSLLQRCRGICAAVSQRTVRLLLDFVDEQLETRVNYKNKYEIIMHYEVVIHILQMLAYIITKLNFSTETQNDVMKTLLVAHDQISALNFVNMEVVSALNDYLLRGKQNHRLIEITAEIHRKQFERASTSPNALSPCFTPLVHYEPESYYSKNSAWTTRGKQPKQYELDFFMPFSQMVDVLVKYSIDEKETPKKHINPPQRLEDKVTKKIK